LARLRSVKGLDFFWLKRAQIMTIQYFLNNLKDFDFSEELMFSAGNLKKNQMKKPNGGSFRNILQISNATCFKIDVLHKGKTALVYTRAVFFVYW
jgi:hypothetical protein